MKNYKIKFSGRLPEVERRQEIFEAIQWNGDNLKDVIAFIGRHHSSLKWAWDEFESVIKDKGLKIFTFESNHIAEIGDFIIKSNRQGFHACKPSVFKEVYKEVE